MHSIEGSSFYDYGATNGNKYVGPIAWFNRALTQQEISDIYALKDA
jgi:hypothetical protein